MTLLAPGGKVFSRVEQRVKSTVECVIQVPHPRIANEVKHAPPANTSRHPRLPVLFCDRLPAHEVYDWAYAKIEQFLSLSQFLIAPLEASYQGVVSDHKALRAQREGNS
jgi:hypothetical protein